MWNPGSAVNKQEIWMINQYAITPDLPGGTRHYDFGCELAKRGFTVRIFASDVNLALRRHTKLARGELFRVQDVNGVQFVWVAATEYQRNDWHRIWNMLTFTGNVCRVGLHIATRPRTIIGSSPHPFAAFAAWLLSKAKHSRFILELRDLWPQALIDMGGMREGSITAGLLRILEKFLYRVASKIVVLAPGSREYLLRRGVPSDKIVYIPNGVHLANFQRSLNEQMDSSRLISELRKRFQFDRFTIVYTGAHGPANALDTILKAADLLRDRSDIQFVLVGDGPSKPDLIEEARRLELDNLRFMNPVPKEDIPRLLAAADASVITLRSVDAFSYGVSPNKLFDYMASARPVICAVPGYMAELVKKTGAGLVVEPENPKALADAVRRLCNMSDGEREAMGKCGRELIKSDFSRERLAERLQSIV